MEVAGGSLDGFGVSAEDNPYGESLAHLGHEPPQWRLSNAQLVAGFSPVEKRHQNTNADRKKVDFTG
jgi:hypothetical protein